MSLLSAWALAGLVLTVPLVLLHLRRQRPPVRDVASLLAWRELPGQASSSSKRLGVPVLPLLLALQLLALILLVLGLARPASALGRPGTTRIYVIDDSIWMQAHQAGGDRLTVAQHLLRSQIRRLPSDVSVRIVVAGATPSIFFSGKPHAAAQAIDRVQPTDGPGDLTAAVRLAAGLRHKASDRIVLARAPEDSAPAVRAAGGTFTDTVIGGPVSDQGLTGADARCGLPEPSPCEVFARVRNNDATAQDDRVEVLEDGRQASSLTVAVSGHSSSPVAFRAPAGATLELKLGSEDSLPADNSAFVTVPDDKPVRITLVGNPTKALPLARALASDPGVQLRLRTPASYRKTDPATSDLLVLDGWMPAGGLPHAPSLLLVAPPHLPGGRVRGFLSDSRVSGSDPLSNLLTDVDLTSLTIDSNQARRLTLPSWMTAAVWSPGGPLLATGSTGGQRVAVLSFDPYGSDLPQLTSFPILIANIVAWSQEWAPGQATAGESVLTQAPPGTTSATLAASGQPTKRLAVGSQRPHSLVIGQPGLYTLSQRGSWGTRSQPLAVNVDSEPVPASTAAVDLTTPAVTGGSTRTPWWPWLVAAALVVLLAEWIYAMRYEPRLAVS